jgi:hypothetical protein
MGKPAGEYRYNPKWEKEFAWVTADPSSKKQAFCKYCKTDMKARLDTLKDHAKGKRHLARVPYANVRSKLPFKPVTVIPSELKKVELKLTAMAICHTSFNALDHISEILGEEGKGSYLEKIKLHRTKAS